MLASALLDTAAGAVPVDYQGYLAPAETCPGADVPTLTDAEQGAAMVCMIDYARGVQGSGKLARPSLLATSSAIKADEIVRCADVSHTACGRAAMESFKTAGYISPGNAPQVGENLGVATGTAATARTIMLAWLRDEVHRNTLLGAQWRDGGVAVRHRAATPSLDDGAVWVSHFGSGRGSAAGSATPGRAGSAAGGGPGQATGSGPRSTPGGSASGAGSGSGTSPATGTAPAPARGGGGAPGLRLRMTPSRAVTGRRTRFRFVLSSPVAGGRQAIAYKLVYFARQRVLTDARGRATITARMARSGRYEASAVLGAARATATVAVGPRR